jgi:hypothetical protein
MKRRLIAVIFVLALILSGCGSEIAENTVTVAETTTAAAVEMTTVLEKNETVTTTKAVTTTAAIEAEAENDEVISPDDGNHHIDYALLEDYDTRTDLFFTALTANDTETLEYIGCTRSDGVYDFLADIKFGGYAINSGVTTDNPGMSHPPKTYNVSLTVLESENPRFPVGENTYEITALDAGFGPYFSPLHLVGDENKIKITDMINAETLSDEASICYYFTLEMLPLYGRESVDGFSMPEDDIDLFYSGLARFFGHIPAFAQPESYENYNAAAKQMLGIDTEFNHTDIEPLWLGANMLDAVLVSETDKSVVIDYYADSLLLVKAFTVEYNLDTTNGFRFNSIKNLYDSGFEPSRYST